MPTTKKNTKDADVLKAILKLEKRMDKRFDEVDQRLDNIEKRLDGIENYVPSKGQLPVSIAPKRGNGARATR